MNLANLGAFGVYNVHGEGIAGVSLRRAGESFDMGGRIFKFVDISPLSSLRHPLFSKVAGIIGA